MLLLIVSFPVLAENESPAAGENNQTTEDEIDSLFGGQGDKTGTGDGDKTGTEDGDSGLLSLLGEKGITLGASFFLMAGYSPGFDFLPMDVSDPDSIEYIDMAILKLEASISFNIRLSRELRVFQRIASKAPELVPEIEELFCDYSMLDAVFLRIGRHNIAWGISPNYAFTNLLARLPEDVDPEDESADSFAFKMTIPVGVGGFDVVMFTRSSFWDADDDPDVDEIGAGGKFNLALDNFDFNIGGYFHRDLNLRFFYSLKTTLPFEIEAYTEGLLAVDLDYFEAAEDGQIVFSANAGFYFDLFDQTLRINTEYFYNGEESELDVKGALFPLFAGHNVALNISWAFFNGKFKLLFQGKYNITENSGVILPAATLDVIPHCTFSLGIPYVLGPVSGGYFQENDDNKDRRIALVFAIILRGKI